MSGFVVSVRRLFIFWRGETQGEREKYKQRRRRRMKLA